MNNPLRKSEDTPRIEPIFSYPTLEGVPDTIHEDTVTKLLAQAVPGSTVYFSIFTLTRMNIAEALIDASQRGVSINILIDEHSIEAKATRHLHDRLPKDVTITADGAIGNNNNHNKFLLLERLENGNRKVVWQSSSNFTNTQQHLHNSSVVIREDTPLYKAYESYWKDMAAGKQDLNYNRSESGQTATVHFSPRSDFDTHLQALEDIECTEDSTIHFLYSIWTRYRSEIIDRIEELVEEGCTVNAIIDQEASTVGPLLERAGANVLEYPHYTHQQGPNPDQITNIHSTSMLIEADFTTDGGTKRRRLVYTGSQNLSGPGLANNDEALLEIEDSDVYRQFLNDWERVYKQGKEARRRQDRKGPSPPPVPTAENYPTEVLADDFATDSGEYTILSPFDQTESGEVTIKEGKFRASADSSFFTVVQSSHTPGSPHIAGIIDVEDFIDVGEGEDSIFVGLFKDDANFLATWYNHTRLDTGFDLYLDGERVEGGIQNGLALNSDSQFAFVLDDNRVSGFADIGEGWQHAFTTLVEAVDPTDAAVRDSYRYGVGTFGEAGSITLNHIEFIESGR
jgi:PLD-like domain